MDTYEREIEFQKNLSEGWQEDYKQYRQSWIDLAKNKTLREYPFCLLI